MTARRIALGALAAWALGPALACGDHLGSGTQRIDDAQFVLVYKLQPEPPPVGRHFSIDIVLCPVGAAALPAELRVDAQMPEHRHGMNYRPSVTTLAAGRYRAEGLMFHMPGRWQLSFELRSPDAAPRRLTQWLQVG